MRECTVFVFRVGLLRTLDSVQMLLNTKKSNRLKCTAALELGSGTSNTTSTDTHSGVRRKTHSQVTCFLLLYVFVSVTRPPGSPHCSHLHVAATMRPSACEIRTSSERNIRIHVHTYYYNARHQHQHMAHRAAAVDVCQTTASTANSKGKFPQPIICVYCVCVVSL